MFLVPEWSRRFQVACKIKEIYLLVLYVGELLTPVDTIQLFILRGEQDFSRWSKMRNLDLVKMF